MKKPLFDHEDLRHMYADQMHLENASHEETLPDFFLWLERRKSQDHAYPNRLFYSEILNAHYFGRDNLQVKAMEFFAINQRRLDQTKKVAL